MRMNGYERRIANRLQMQMSKKEAEEAIYEIREGLYGDPYEQIHPTRIVGRYGEISDKWPEQRYVIWAYFHNDYSRLQEQQITDISEIKELPPIRKDLMQKEGESSKQYNKRFRNQNPYRIVNVAPEWHSMRFDDKDQGKKFIEFAKKYGIELKKDDIFAFDYGYKKDLPFYTNGVEAVQIIDTARKEGIEFEINNMKFNENKKEAEKMMDTGVGLYEEYEKEGIADHRPAIDKFVKTAFENASKIQMGENNYQDIMVNQRVEGPTNAGSSYNMTADEIKNMIRTSEWSEVFDNPNVGEGCRLFKTEASGLNGIVNITELPNYKNKTYYAIDPKGTGNISIGVGNVPKKEEYYTYLIVGPEEINGKTEQVVYTFHPGEPVRPSVVEAKDIPDGTKLTYEQVQNLGFDKAKFMSPDMVKEYEAKAEKNLKFDNFNDVLKSAYVETSKKESLNITKDNKNHSNDEFDVPGIK